MLYRLINTRREAEARRWMSTQGSMTKVQRMWIGITIGIQVVCYEVLSTPGMPTCFRFLTRDWSLHNGLIFVDGTTCEVTSADGDNGSLNRSPREFCWCSWMHDLILELHSYAYLCSSIIRQCSMDPCDVDTRSGMRCSSNWFETSGTVDNYSSCRPVSPSSLYASNSKDSILFARSQWIHSYDCLYISSYIDNLIPQSFLPRNPPLQERLFSPDWRFGSYVRVFCIVLT